MTQEIISGLHSCKPGHEPVIGQVKTFTVEQKLSKNGKPYLKIKSAGAEHGGTPYRVLEAAPTGFTDSYGNISFNIGIEPAVKGGDVECSTQTKAGLTETATSGRTSNAAQQVQSPSAAPMSKDDYWRRKEERDEDRQRWIIRQHSQSMAIEVLKLKVALSELTVEDITPAKLRKLTDYFDQDVIEPQTKNGGSERGEDLPTKVNEYQPEPF